MFAHDQGWLRRLREGVPMPDGRPTLPARVADLVRRMTLAEKVTQLSADAPGIPRLGIPADREVAAVIPFGYPKKEPGERQAPVLESKLHIDRW